MQRTVMSSGGTWSMTIEGVTFATGTYSCNAFGCSYTDSVVGSSTAFSFNTSVSGTTTSATGFRRMGRGCPPWRIGRVLTSEAQIGKVVSGAARIEGPLASGDPGRDNRPIFELADSRPW